MASASQKKPTAKRKSTSAKGTSTRTKKPAQPQKQPIRREVWSVALLVLALCTVVSYCGISAIFIDWLALLLKGVGYQGFVSLEMKAAGEEELTRSLEYVAEVFG